MKLFDNKVQETKYKVLREVAYQTWKGNDAFAEFNEIASEVIPKDEPPQTCCIYKDRGGSSFGITSLAISLNSAKDEPPLSLYMQQV